MKTENLVIAGIVVIGAVLLMSRRANAAAPTSAGAMIMQPRSRQNTSAAGMLLFGNMVNALGKSLGASWSVNPNQVQTIDWTEQGGAIGNYTGLTQDQANQQAVTDFNNQFISPFGSNFAWNG